MRFSTLYPDGRVPSEDEPREALMDGNLDAELDLTLGDDRAHVAAEFRDDKIDAED